MNSGQGTIGSGVGNGRRALAEEVPLGYKRTEAGVIPEDWEARLLGDIAHIKTGSRNNQDKIDDGKYPFFVRSAIVERINSYTFEGEAILVPGEGNIGNIFHYINGRFDVHQRVYKISRFSADVCGKFIYYNMVSCFGAHAMINTVKATVDSLRLPTFKMFALSLPSDVAEQRAIAEALSDVDGLLAALEALIAKKQAIKKAAMQQLLTGKTRLPGFSREWERTSMGQIGSCYGGLSGKGKRDFGRGSACYVTFLGVLENVILGTRHVDYVHIAPNESQNRVFKGDLLFNSTSETPGDLAMGAVMHEQISNLYLNSFCFGFRIHNKNKYHPLFLAYFFRGSVGRTIMNGLAQGATRYNMSKSQFATLELFTPAYAEQAAIATILFDMDAEIAALEQRRDKARAVKQGMMQQLLTGRVRLI